MSKVFKVVRVFNKFQSIPTGYVEVDTTSRGSFRDLSPFYLGPIKLPTGEICLKFENLWQYSKVYPVHIGPHGGVMQQYIDWRRDGFNNHRAQRHPMGKGAVPVFSLTDDMVTRMDYITARKLLYIPYYARLVRQTRSFEKIRNWVNLGYNVALRDFDGYDHDAMGMSLVDVVNNPNKVMGHAFVIKMLLMNRLEECMK